MLVYGAGAAFFAWTQFGRCRRRLLDLGLPEPPTKVVAPEHCCKNLKYDKLFLELPNATVHMFNIYRLSLLYNVLVPFTFTVNLSKKWIVCTLYIHQFETLKHTIINVQIRAGLHSDGLTEPNTIRTVAKISENVASFNEHYIL